MKNNGPSDVDNEPLTEWPSHLKYGRTKIKIKSKKKNLRHKQNEAKNFFFFNEKKDWMNSFNFALVMFLCGLHMEGVNGAMLVANGCLLDQKYWLI